MSVNPPDEATRRVNYFNGQRLAADDFRAEQGYHVGMRRVLNRALYSPGVVVGLEVELAKSNPADPADAHRVVVRRGLAFDSLGREIFLPTDVKVQVQGAPSAVPGVVFGNLLTVSYREQRKFPGRESCTIGAPFTPCGGDASWGAPTRIVADAIFEFLDSWPTEESGRIVLGQIELSSTCNVVRVLAGVRKYAVPVKPPAVTALSIEGEKDIDAANPKELIFHIRGGFPSSATLLLQAKAFSPLHYTEMPPHKHTLAVALSTQPGQPAHAHSLGAIDTTDELDPSIIGFTALCTSGADGDYAIRLWQPANYVNNTGAWSWEDTPWDMKATAQLTATNTLHRHHIAAGQQTSTAGGVPDHTHTFSKNETEVGGQTFIDGSGEPRTGAAHTYFGDLKIEIDGHDVTQDVLEQLKASGTDWPTLGLGKVADPMHILVTKGTGEIDLLRLPGVDLVPGTHTLKFTPGSGGGQLHYNLYVE